MLNEEKGCIIYKRKKKYMKFKGICNDEFLEYFSVYGLKGWKGFCRTIKEIYEGKIKNGLVVWI